MRRRAPIRKLRSIRRGPRGETNRSLAMPHVASHSTSDAREAPIITVFGATGAQGGGLARAVLADPGRRFRLRAVTRKPDSPAARALAANGADIVRADLDDAASVRGAMDGAYGAFCVTNFWE